MNSQPRKKTAVLISGRGSNMASLIEAAKNPDFPADIALVLSNVADAPGLAKATAQGIPTAVVAHGDFPDRESFGAALSERLEAEAIDIVCLAGFMRILSQPFTKHWQGRLINIHPSLLPDFRGLNVYQRALDAGVSVSGCTVHFVIPELDEGPTIAQATVPVHARDDAQTLAQRILEQEHRVYPLALDLIASGRAKMENGRTMVDGTPAPNGIPLNSD